MPAFLTTLIFNLVAAKLDGQVVGLLASKTQWGATTASLAGLWPLVPGIAAKDPAAIGNAVLIVVGWLVALYGRLKAA